MRRCNYLTHPDHIYPIKENMKNLLDSGGIKIKNKWKNKGHSSFGFRLFLPKYYELNSAHTDCFKQSLIQSFKYNIYN